MNYAESSDDEEDVFMPRNARQSRTKSRARTRTLDDDDDDDDFDAAKPENAEDDDGAPPLWDSVNLCIKAYTLIRHNRRYG